MRSEILPKIVDHGARREEVASAVLAVIGRAGFEGATLREVARGAGCTTGALSHYFRDKRELMLFAFRLATERAAQRIERRLVGLSGLAAVRASLLEVLPIDEERRLISAIWLTFHARAITAPDLAFDHREYYRGWRERLLPLLEQAVEAGEIAEGVDRELQIEHLTTFVLGLALQVLLDQERFPAGRQEAMVDAMLAGLAAQRGDERARARLRADAR